MKIKGISILLIGLLFSGLTASAQSWLWGEQGSTSLKADLSASNVATNNIGNVYQAGGFAYSLIFGTDTLTTPEDDAYLVKYNQNGNLLWARQSKSKGSGTLGFSVATDDSDNAYIAGTTGDTTVFGTDTFYDIGGFYASTFAYLVKYDPNGNVIWAKEPGIKAGEVGGGNGGVAVATDNFGHEYVTGYDNFLIKFDRNGNIIWTVQPKLVNQHSYDFPDVGYCIAPDIFGNVYLSGYFEDSITFGSYQLYSANPAVFIAKFDSNGNVLWAQQSTHTPHYFQIFSISYGGFSVATDRSGAAYLTGAISDSISFGSYTFTSTDIQFFNFLVVKFNPSGTIAWGKEATQIDNSSWGSFSICSDDSNHIYISGAEGNTAPASFMFANNTFSITDTTNDVPSFLLKLDSSGQVICGSILPGGGVQPNAVASDSTGKFVYMGGAFITHFALGNDTLVDKTGGYDSYIGRWEPCFQCDLVVTTIPRVPSICDGQNVSLIANGGTNYTWVPSLGLSATIGSNVVANPTTTTIYTVSTSSGSCSDSEQIVVTVDMVPVLTAMSGSACSGQSAVLTVSGGTNYVWSPSSTLSASTGDIVIATPTVTTSYTVTGTDSLGCTSNDTDVVTIIPSPNKPTFIQQNDTLISSSKYDNQWYRNDTLLKNDTSRELIITVLGNYWVIVNNEANGCSTSSDSVNITSITGIKQLSANNNQLSVYPNPFSNDIVITINSSAQDVKGWDLQIIDVLGQTVYTKSLLNPLKGTFEIDLSNLPNRVYFISVINKMERTVVPVVKQN